MNTIFEILENVLLKGKIYIPRKWILWSAYYVLPVVLLLGYFTPFREEMQESLGSGAQILLLVILFVKPASVFLPKLGILRTIIGYRRQLGISTFYLAFFHFLYYAQPGNIAQTFIDVFTGTEPLRYGAWALTLMAILYITSNNISMKWLKKWWKRIQRLAYVALPLVLLHAALVENDGIATPIAVTLLFIAVKIAEWWILLQRKTARKQKKEDYEG